MTSFAGQDFYIDRDALQFDVQITYFIPGYSDPETGEYFGDTNWTASYAGGGTGGFAGEGDSPVLYLGFAGGDGLTSYDFSFLAQNTFSADSYTFEMRVHEAGVSSVGHTVTGHGGIDLFVTGYGDDSASGLGGMDYFDLGGGSDTAYGGADGDYLDGGAGDDALAGGEGDDVYVVDSALDVVTEAAGEGDDTVFASVDWTIAANVERLVLIGAAGTGTGDGAANVIEGNGLENELLGEGGDDQLYGLGADDVLRGGDGADLLDGGAGDDRMVGGLGDDVYRVDSLADEVVEVGSGGNDTVRVAGLAAYTLDAKVENLVLETAGAGTGNGLGNSLWGSGGDDVLEGAGGKDALVGGAGDDLLSGGAGGDDLDGGAGLDLVSYAGEAVGVVVQLAAGAGYAGDDLASIEGVVGSAFADRLYGGAGDNLIIGGAGGDTLSGGLGVDTLSYEGSSAGVTVVLASRQASGGDAQGDLISGFENVTGGGGDDSLAGDAQANVLHGSAGADVLSGAGGSDELVGGSGADSLNGDAGSDWLSYATSSDGVAVDLGLGTASGGDAAGDIFSGIENLRGGLGADTLRGDAANNLIEGGAGDDALYGGDGNDVVEGGAGADTLNGGDGVDTLTYAHATSGVTVSLSGGVAYGGAQGDSVSGFENLVGSPFGDALYGGTAGNKLYGGGGNDFLSGGAGADTLEGGAGVDSIYVSFGGGADRVTDFVAGPGGDVLYVDLGESFDSFGEVMAAGAMVNGSAQFSFGGGTRINLVGVNLATLTAENFFFPTYEEI